MLQWMAWTPHTAIFFAAIAAMLVLMTVLELVYPTTPRKGCLPIVTTRGDRLFMSLVCAGFIHLAWLGLTEDLSLWWATVLSGAWLAIMMRWG
jgi:predicted small integral membrane protein